MRKQRVAVISQLPPPVHGSTLVTKLLLDDLSQLGLDVSLVDRRFSHSVSEIGSFSLRKVSAAISLVFRAARQTRRADTCIFFVTNRKGSFLVDCVVSWVLRAQKTRTIAYVHTIGYSRLAASGRLWPSLVRVHFSSAHTVVCLSEKLTADVVPFLPRRANVVTIANTIPEQTGRIPDFKGRQTVTYLSNLIPEKGISDFLEVTRSLGEEHPELHFVAAGNPAHSTQLDELRQQPGRCVLTGAVDAAKKAKLLEETRVLVFPSSYPFEAQPLVILEAMEQGIPVVAYDAGGIGDVIEDGVNGMLVPVGDVTALREAVKAVLRDEEYATRLSEGARATYAEKHSRETFRAAWAEQIGKNIA